MSATEQPSRKLQALIVEDDLLRKAPRSRRRILVVVPAIIVVVGGIALAWTSHLRARSDDRAATPSNAVPQATAVQVSQREADEAKEAEAKKVEVQNAEEVEKVGDAEKAEDAKKAGDTKMAQAACATNARRWCKAAQTRVLNAGSVYDRQYEEAYGCRGGICGQSYSGVSFSRSRCENHYTKLCQRGRAVFRSKPRSRHVARLCVDVDNMDDWQCETVILR